MDENVAMNAKLKRAFDICAQICYVLNEALSHGKWLYILDWLLGKEYVSENMERIASREFDRFNEIIMLNNDLIVVQARATASAR